MSSKIIKCLYLYSNHNSIKHCNVFVFELEKCIWIEICKCIWFCRVVSVFGHKMCIWTQPCVELSTTFSASHQPIPASLRHEANVVLRDGVWPRPRHAAPARHDNWRVTNQLQWPRHTQTGKKEGENERVQVARNRGSVVRSQINWFKVVFLQIKLFCNSFCALVVNVLLKVPSLSRCNWLFFVLMRQQLFIYLVVFPKLVIYTPPPHLHISSSNLCVPILSLSSHILCEIFLHC